MKKIRNIGTTLVVVLASGLLGCATAPSSTTNNASTQTVHNPAAISTSAVISSQPTGTYAIEPNHTSLLWRVVHFGLSNYTARFDKMSGTIEFNSSSPASSTANIVVDMTSVNTGLPNFDTEIENQAFEAGQFPTANFTSTSLALTSADTGTMTGNLTFHGVTNPIAFEVKINGGRINPFSQRNTLGFSARGKFKRSEFGVTKWTPFVSDEVELIIESEFVKQ